MVRPAFQPLTGSFEPSAIQQLPDGRFLAVEDEKRHPLSLIKISADGSVNNTALTAGLLLNKRPNTFPSPPAKTIDHKRSGAFV